MLDILARAGCYIGIIILGYVLRQKGFFKEDAFGVLAKIVINRYRYQGFKRCVLAMGMQRFSVYPEYDKLADDLRDQLDLK